MVCTYQTSSEQTIGCNDNILSGEVRGRDFGACLRKITIVNGGRIVGDSVVIDDGCGNQMVIKVTVVYKGIYS